MEYAVLKKRSLVVFVLFVVAGLFFAAESHAQTNGIEKEIKKAEAEQRKAKEKIKEIERLISDRNKQEISYIQQIQKINNAMYLTENRISITTMKRNQILSRMGELGNEIKDTSGQMEYVKGLLEDRLVAIYKYGNVAEFNLFLSAPGAKDAMATSYLLGKIAAEDQKLIEELSTKRNKLNAIHEELSKQKKNLETQNRSLSDQKNILARNQNQRTTLLKKVRSEKEAFIAQQNELRRASQELQNTIYSLLEKKRKALAEQRGGKEEIYYKGGKLAWPLRGKITSDYGGRVHPVFKTRSVHTGIDIDGNTGDPVRAANDGEVLYAGWLRGYGQVIILDHGASLTTVYAHLSRINVRESSKIRRGDVIGHVGSTGVATGPHLHFEVRVNGSTTNPLKYL